MNIRKITAVLLSLCILVGVSSNTYAIENTPTGVEDTANIEKVENIETPQVPTQNDVDIQVKADILNKLNIISGDGKGNYNLESQLRRSEAATFIVKMLGKDSYIKENKDKYKATGFKDVKSTDWFISYVSFCEQNSIISGIGGNNFGPNKYISEKAFLVMIMKCLGYSSEAGDFTWETVNSAAYQLGLVSNTEYEQKVEDNKDYKREDVVLVLYKALTLNLKDSALTMLQSLVNEGNIDQKIAFSTGLLKDTMLTAINSTTPQNDSRISVNFNEQVAQISSANIIVYESGNKSNILPIVSSISQNDRKLVLGTTKQIVDKDYTVEISNVTDLEGNITKKMVSTFKGYKVSEIKSDYFKISRVENISQNEISVYFTHPINENSEVASYYKIYENDKLFVDGSSSTLKVRLMGGSKNGLSITLYDKVLKPDNEYKVKISGNLVSVYGTTLFGGLGDEALFIPTNVSTEEFSVKSINATSNNTVQLNFSSGVNPTLAKQIYNYNITDSANNPIQIKQAISLGAKGESVSLTINSYFDKTKSYNIMINRLNDVDKKYEIVEKTFIFSGAYPDFVEFNISSVTPVDTETIIVNFNKAIDEECALNKDSYTMMETGTSYRSFVPDNIYFSKQNPTQVKLYFKANKALKNSINYSVRIYPSFKDYTGASINKYIDYGFVPKNISSTKILIARAAIISMDTIMVKFFGKEISMDSPNSNSQNYSIEYSEGGEILKKIPIAVTYIDLDTVILKFNSLDIAQTYTIKCNEVRSYADEIYKSSDLKCTVSMGQ